MSLEDKLAALRAASAERIPPEKRAVMQQATKELRESGIMDRMIKVGDPLPRFALANADGADVFSDDLLAKGAVVLTVFRGHW
jgi:hypothetical protein